MQIKLLKSFQCFIIKTKMTKSDKSIKAKLQILAIGQKNLFSQNKFVAKLLTFYTLRKIMCLVVLEIIVLVELLRFLNRTLR